MTTGTASRSSHAVVHRPLRVALDCSFLDLPASGVGSYVRSLAEALLRRDDVEMHMLRHPSRLRWLGPRAQRMAWDAVGVELARLAAARETDLLHVPANGAPVVSAVPRIVTIHDVIPYLLPEYRRSRSMRLYLAAMRRTVQRAEIVLAPSAFSAGEVSRVLGIPLERIRVTPLAADPSLEPARDPATVRRRLAEAYGVTGRYLLHMAGFDRRKNLPLLVRAFARALPEMPGDVSLVLAGAPHTDNPSVYPLVEPVILAEGIEDRVVLTGRVTNDGRRLLYQGASGYVTPSRYEGFGLTPLEAMACGVPVIAANRTSLPEVVGDAGLLVEPEVDAFTRAMVALMTDERLDADLARRGLERAARFSWDHTAALTVEAYRAAIS